MFGWGFSNFIEEYLKREGRILSNNEIYMVEAAVRDTIAKRFCSHE
jgi:hypothetical protein